MSLNQMELDKKLFEISELPDFLSVPLISPSMIGVDGSTPLHVAALRGDDELVSELLSEGVDYNHRTKEGLTPLHFAIMFGKPTIIEKLLNNGADSSIVSNDGLSGCDLTHLLDDDVLIKQIQNMLMTRLAK